jgi:putative transposase
MNTDEDHIHILFSAPTQIQLSKIINSFKAVSSRYIRNEFQEELKKYYWKTYFWSSSYLIISSGGASIETIQTYIKNQ